jgi:hypothetical protein
MWPSLVLARLPPPLRLGNVFVARIPWLEIRIQVHLYRAEKWLS